MSDLMTRILIGVVAIGFILVSLFLTKPDSSGGRLSRKLSIANAVGLTYIALNLVVLFVVPFAWVLIEAFR